MATLYYIKHKPFNLIRVLLINGINKIGLKVTLNARGQKEIDTIRLTSDSAPNYRFIALFNILLFWPRTNPETIHYCQSLF